MICPNADCAKPVPEDADYCPACGTPPSPAPNQSVSNSGDAGRDILQYQAGRDQIFYPSNTPSEDSSEYSVKWSWKSPLTLAVLTWVSAVLGVLSLGSVYKTFKPLLKALVGGASLLEAPVLKPFWIFVMLALVVLTALLMALRRIAKHRTQHFSHFSFLPAITGWGGRIGLARLQGNCPKDGGKFRFYNKPMKWIEDLQSGKRRITERAMVAECVKNSDHWWPVDKTDGSQV